MVVFFVSFIVRCVVHRPYAIQIFRGCRDVVPNWFVLGTTVFRSLRPTVQRPGRCPQAVVRIGLLVPYRRHTVELQLADGNRRQRRLLEDSTLHHPRIFNMPFGILRTGPEGIVCGPDFS